MVNGSRPALDFISTARPDVRSPCSTEGIPRITSTDSIVIGGDGTHVKSRVGRRATTHYALPRRWMAGDRVCRLALFERGVPSTHRWRYPYCLFGYPPKLRVMDNVLALERPLPPEVTPPGSSCMMSCNELV